MMTETQGDREDQENFIFLGPVNHERCAFYDSSKNLAQVKTSQAYEFHNLGKR